METDTAYPRISEVTGRPYLSPSQINRLLTCGRRYYSYYYLEETTPLGRNLLLGDVAHRSIAWAFERRIMGREPQLGDILDKSDEIATTIIHDEDFLDKMGDAAPDEARLPDWIVDLVFEANGLVEAMWNFFPHDECEPTAVEQSMFCTLTDELDLHGFIDLQYTDQQGCVGLLDWKTTGRKPSTPKDNHLLQILLYANALGCRSDEEHTDDQWPDELVLPYVVNRKRGTKVYPFDVPTTSTALDWAWDQAQLAAVKLSERRFDPEPLAAGWLCDARFCGHYDSCPGAASFLDD